jgi:hypothetical protein
MLPMIIACLFAYLYLRTLPADLEPQHYNLTKALRLNLEEFTQEEREEFAGYVLKSETTRRGGVEMRYILDNLEAHV